MQHRLDRVPGEALDDRGGPVEHFTPTGGRVLGVLGLLLAAVVVVVGLVRPGDVIAPVMVGAAIGGLISWAALLRPRVSASAETLHLRNMFETVEIPLAAVDELVVRQVLAVRVGEKRYVSPAVGRKLRKMVKGPRPSNILFPGAQNLPASMDDTVGPSKSSNKQATTVDYADHVEGTLRGLIDDARQRHGVGRYSDESLALASGVRRVPAWPEIGALAVLVVAFVVTILVG